MVKNDGGMDGKDAVGVQVDKGRFSALMATLRVVLGGWLAALWEPFRRYFYLTKRDARGFAVWCGVMALTLAVKWAYPKWEAARLSLDRLPAVPAMPAAGAGTGGRMADAGGWQVAGGYGAAGQATGNGTGTLASGGSVASPGENASVASPDTARPSPRAASPSPYGSPYRKKTFTVDLNLGDTLDFQQLRGIGPAYARRIVAYRERLGGFVDKRQLLEVWGVDSALYDRIAPSLELTSAPGQAVRPIRPLCINRMSVQELKQHPYLDYYQAKEIVRFRERYGAFR
ncbi:MAG: helix-hairpin-helix domain-containing protein, partial [Bacteroidales bacterium]|nr:helix-hairpin-helix domain-containing protein [Bacteroidales bacterium]